ncbi:UNVERIFIED_ORG: hypothetical protein OKW25_002181 [Pseudomonas vranovensis]|nr:hypothetical protein [Pseudomonas vranovensis]
MVKWYEIPDAAWELVAELFEQPRRNGRPRADDRLMLSASGCFTQAPRGAKYPIASALGQRSTNGFGIGVTKERST